MPPNNALIEEYIRDMKKRNVSDLTIRNVTLYLTEWGKLLNFTASTVDDLLAAKGEIGKRLKPNTFNSWTYEIKRFYLWMIKKGYSPIDVEQIREIKLPKKDHMTKTAAQMLTYDDAYEIINNMPNARDRCIAAFIYEGGMRPIEVAGLSWKDVKIEPEGIYVNTAKKTGVPRIVILRGVKEYLVQWKGHYQAFGMEPESDNPVFINLHRPYVRIKPHSITRYIYRRQMDKGLTKKKIFPYLMRHSKITQLLADGVPEQAVKMQMWGSTRSKMIETYAHLTGKQSADLILETYGVKKYARKNQRGPIVCDRCMSENAAIAEYCIKCGTALTDEARARVKAYVEEAKESPEYQDLMKEIAEIKKRLARKR